MLGLLFLLTSALALVVVARADDRVLAASMMAVAAFCQLANGSPACATCLDVGRRHAGVVTGFMNTAGQIGGTIAPVLVGYAVEEWGSWTIPFYVTAGLLCFGAAIWMLIDPTTSVIELDESGRGAKIGEAPERVAPA